MATDPFGDLVRTIGEELDPYISREGRHTGLDVVYRVPIDRLGDLLDAAIECGYEPRKAQKPRTICATYGQPGIQLHNVGWGNREKAGCIIPGAYDEDIHVSWTSSIG